MQLFLPYSVKCVFLKAVDSEQNATIFENAADIAENAADITKNSDDINDNSADIASLRVIH